MATNEDYKDINLKLIKILSDLLATGNWEASLFLRTAHKKLQDFYEEAIALEEQLSKTPSFYREKEHLQKAKEGFIKVFVSLYQSDPHNLVKWENTLKSIKEYSITRPIYREEAYIQEAISSKVGGANEGYAVIYIQESDIIPPYAGKIIEDRFGHELLTLRGACLLPQNIREFVHQGKRYEFKDGKLSLKSDIS